ncbi:MAG TPA: hypothetical protein DDY77_06270 [Clostridiales bacterium]|nr:hypothetical protein [Clostridiales bacterium]
MKTMKKLSLSILAVVFVAALLLGVNGIKANAETTGETVTAKYVTDMSVTLTEDIVMKYYVETPDGYSVKDMTFAFLGETYKAELSEKDGKTIAAFTGLSPLYLDEKVGYTLTLTNGNDAEEKVETVEAENGTSFTDYAKALFAKSATELKFSADEKTAMDTLLVYTLKYGDTAVAFKGLEKPSFMTAAGDKASLFTDYVLATGETDKALMGDGEEVTWKYAGINFGEKLNLYFEFTGNFTAPVTVEFVKKGEKTTVEAENVGTEEEPLFKAYYYGLSCEEFDTTVEATVVADGSAVGKTAVYSLKSNVLYFQESEEVPAYAELAKAVYSYGEKAKAFKNAHTHVGTLTAECNHTFTSGDKFDVSYLENIAGYCEKCGETEIIKAESVTAKTIMPEYGKIDGIDYSTDKVYTGKSITLTAPGFTGEIAPTVEKIIVSENETYKFQAENPDYVDLSGAKLQSGAPNKLENTTKKAVSDEVINNGADGYCTNNITIKGNVIKFMFEVSESGTYKIGLRAQSCSNRGKNDQTIGDVCEFKVDGSMKKATGLIKASVANTTENWKNMLNWTELYDVLGELKLDAGKHTVTVTSLVDARDLRMPNIDYFTITKIAEEVKVSLSGGLKYEDGSLEKTIKRGGKTENVVIPNDMLFITDGNKAYASIDDFIVPETDVTLMAVCKDSDSLKNATFSSKLRYNGVNSSSTTTKDATVVDGTYTYSVNYSSALTSLKFESAPYESNKKYTVVLTVTSSIDFSFDFDMQATDAKGVAHVKFNIKKGVATTMLIDIPAGASGYPVMYFDEAIAANTSFTLAISAKLYQY